jgi:14-3-3 protein epsilon
MSSKISCEERSLISAAYKNFAGNKRAELRVINAIERKEAEKENNE